VLVIAVHVAAVLPLWRHRVLDLSEQRTEGGGSGKDASAGVGRSPRRRGSARRDRDGGRTAPRSRNAAATRLARCSVRGADAWPVPAMSYTAAVRRSPP
jgi:hypothetical protein